MGKSTDKIREHWEPGYEVCTFQVHIRKRDRSGRLAPTGSKSITVPNISLPDGLKIVRLGIEAFRTARE
mgnify:FL=1